MNYYAVERSTDHLAHYGVKGMRWGVRRAIATGNQAALDRHYRKAARKLAKLQKIGDHPGLSKAKAAAYGAAAAGTGALALGGTGLVSKGLRYISAGANTINQKNFGAFPKGKKYKALNKLVSITDKASTGIDDWGKKATTFKLNRKVLDPKTNTLVDKELINKSVSNNKLFRAGAGLATAGLAARSAHHAYRARNAEKYREKAEDWQNAMDDVFAGTEYEGSYAKLNRRQQRRRRGY